MGSLYLDKPVLARVGGAICSVLVHRTGRVFNSGGGGGGTPLPTPERAQLTAPKVLPGLTPGTRGDPDRTLGKK